MTTRDADHLNGKHGNSSWIKLPLEEVMQPLKVATNVVHDNPIHIPSKPRPSKSWKPNGTPKHFIDLFLPYQHVFEVCIHALHHNDGLELVLAALGPIVCKDNIWNVL